MTNRYLLSIEQPDGDPPPPEIMDPIMKNVGALMDEMKAAGALVLTSPLAPAAEARVVRFEGGQPLVTDGPYTEAKEHVGGFIVVAAKDLDAALVWAGKAARAITLPIEVRQIVEHV